MFNNYLKIALRNIIRQKTYFLINIFGLVIGFVCFILIILYVRYELSFESHHKNADDIYRVNLIEQHPNQVIKKDHTMAPLGEALTEEIPEILEFGRFTNAGKTLVNYKDKKFIESNIFYADQGIFKLFTIPVVFGDPESALINKYSVVITELMAEKYFGKNNPVGQTLFLDNESYYTVTAVIKDFPKNTNLSADFLISFNTLFDIFGDDSANDWITIYLDTYVYITNNQNLNEIEDKITKVYKAHGSTEVKTLFELEQFSRIHLYSEISNYGNIHYIYLMVVIGILILFIASINFMNLSTARSAKRANEVGLRKVVGANHRQLLIQFLGESILLSFIALFIAFFIVNSILPLFKGITEQELVIPSLIEWDFFLLLSGISLSVGFLSGSYPAFYLSAFSPINVLKGIQSKRGEDVNFRRFLVVLQFSVAIALIISTLSITSQLEFMQNKELGFQKNQIVVLPISGGEFRKNVEPFKQALYKNSNIKTVTGSRTLPSRIGSYNNVTWEGAGENETIELIFNRVDYDFLDTYEIALVKGRNFSREYSSDIVDEERENIAGSVLLNEEAVRSIGWVNPIGKKVVQMFGEEHYNFNVIGVVKDFHFKSLHKKIQPLSLFLRPNYPRYISIKINSKDIQKTIAQIQATWNQFNPEYPFEYYFLDERFDSIYQSEEKMQSLFSYFSLLSIFISCLGLFGLAAFAAEQRTKEIGVRKVVGASISNIILLLSKEFTKWILIANIIAWPLAWIYVNSWLDDFAYRTDVGWWLFVLAGGSTLIIALLTVSSQAIKAAVTNPIESLRYE
jgi:putative ABC transport system permease protein